LRQAVAAGYGDIAALRTNADLESLRSRDDFQKVLQELDKKAKAASP
jgi:hypothetical protein